LFKLEIGSWEIGNCCGLSLFFNGWSWRHLTTFFVYPVRLGRVCQLILFAGMVTLISSCCIRPLCGHGILNTGVSPSPGRSQLMRPLRTLPIHKSTKKIRYIIAWASAPCPHLETDPFLSRPRPARELLPSLVLAKTFPTLALRLSITLVSRQSPSFPDPQTAGTGTPCTQARALKLMVTIWRAAGNSGIEFWRCMSQAL
jgi:hypothetical protein